MRTRPHTRPHAHIHPHVYPHSRALIITFTPTLTPIITIYIYIYIIRSTCRRAALLWAAVLRHHTCICATQSQILLRHKAVGAALTRQCCNSVVSVANSKPEADPNTNPNHNPYEFRKALPGSPQSYRLNNLKLQIPRRVRVVMVGVKVMRRP